MEGKVNCFMIRWKDVLLNCWVREHLPSLPSAISCVSMHKRLCLCVPLWKVSRWRAYVFLAPGNKCWPISQSNRVELKHFSSIPRGDGVVCQSAWRSNWRWAHLIFPSLPFLCSQDIQQAKFPDREEKLQCIFTSDNVSQLIIMVIQFIERILLNWSNVVYSNPER